MVDVIKKSGVFLPMWMYILPVIEKGNLLKLSKELEIAYSHMSKVTNELEKKGLVTKTKIGRELILKYTDKGKKIADMCNRIYIQVIVDAPK